MNVQPDDTNLHFIGIVPEGLIITYMYNQFMCLRLVSSSAKNLVRTTRREDEEQRKRIKEQGV